MDLNKAKKIAYSTEFEGDMRAGFLGAKNAALILAKRVEELELEIENLKSLFVINIKRLEDC